MDWYPLHNNGYQSTARQRSGEGEGEGDKTSSLQFRQQTKLPEVRTMSQCATCGAELKPPVRVPHTVCVKTLYRIAGQDYCRHHIIRAAVAAGVIAEVKAGAGPMVAVPRE